MYLYIGQSAVVRDEEIIGIFDLDITSQSFRTRQYLNRAERAGEVINASEDLPKTFLVAQKREKGSRQRVYLAQPSSTTLMRRLMRGSGGIK